jgi:hypothetical protein
LQLVLLIRDEQVFRRVESHAGGIVQFRVGGRPAVARVTTRPGPRQPSALGPTPANPWDPLTHP